MSVRRFAGLALMLAAAPLAAAPAPAPRMTIASLDQLPKPLPLPYDEQADATKAVDAARARARATGKRLLIDFGGNWCADCRLLAGVMALPELHRFITRHFVVVTVDVGRFDRNQNLTGRYGSARLKGVPALFVIDPRSDKVINAGRTEALADARSMSPQALADWLAQWS